MASCEPHTHTHLEDELQRFHQLKLEIKKLNFIVGESALQNYKLEKSLRNKRKLLSLPIPPAEELHTDISKKSPETTHKVENSPPRATHTKSTSKPAITIRSQKDISRTHLRRTLLSNSPKRSTRESPIDVNNGHPSQHTHTHHSPSTELLSDIPHDRTHEIQYTKRYEKIAPTHTGRSHYDRNRGRSPPSTNIDERRRRPRPFPPPHFSKSVYDFDEKNSSVPAETSHNSSSNKNVYPNTPSLSSPFTPLEDSHYSPKVSERPSLTLSNILPLNSNPRRNNHLDSDHRSYQPTYINPPNHSPNTSPSRYPTRRYPQNFLSKRKIDERKPPRVYSPNHSPHRHILNRLPANNKAKTFHNRSDHLRKEPEEPNSPINISSRKSSSSRYSPSPIDLDYSYHKRKSPPNNYPAYTPTSIEEDQRGPPNHNFRPGNAYPSPRFRYTAKFPRRRPVKRRPNGPGKRYTRSRSPTRMELYPDLKPHKTIKKNLRNKKPLTPRLSRMGSEISLGDFADHTSPLTPS